MTPLVLVRVAALPFAALAEVAGPEIPGIPELLEAEEVLSREALGLSDALHAAAGPPGSAPDADAARRRTGLLALRRAVFNRRPLPAADLCLVGDALRERLADQETRRLAVASRTEAIRSVQAAAAIEAHARLLRFLRRPLVQEGVRLAGRSLLTRVRSLEASDPARFRHDERHVVSKAVAYAARFCTKTSPNGVFCATAVGAFGQGPSLAGQAGVGRLDVILNVAEARKIAECLAGEAAVTLVARPRPNPTLREEDGAWVFWRPATFRNPTDEEVLSRVQHHPVLQALLEEAAPRLLHAPGLLERVAERYGLDETALTPFFLAAVERGIILSEAEIPYNERRPLRCVAQAWRRAGMEAPWLRETEEVEAEVDALADMTARDRITAMDEIGERLRTLPHRRDLREDELFRTDAAAPLTIVLPERTLTDLRAAFSVYVRMFAAMYPSRAHEAAYVARFQSHYPGRLEVPLLELYRGFVEEETKIKRPSCFPDPAETAPRAPGVEAAHEAWSRLRDTLASLARAAKPGDEVTLDHARLDAILGPTEAPQWACGVLFQIAAAGWNEVAAGGGRLVLSSAFNGIGLAVARFAHLHRDSGIVAELASRWTARRREGALLAELTYNHVARTANAGLRPRLFEHEIELPGDTASPEASLLPLSELVVRYDPTADRLGLYWTAREVEVLPVIGSGVSPLGFVSFLVSLGQRGLQFVGYMPGFDVPEVSRWPRLVAGRTVLFRQRWVFEARTLPAGLTALEAARFRHRHGLPRHVFVSTNVEPKPRYVDLASPLLLDPLRRAAASGARVHMTEMLPAPDGLWLPGPEGRHACELLVQMQSDET